MLRSILVATDLSMRSERAIRRAAMLAGSTGAALTMLHVVDDDQPQSVVDAEARDAGRVLVDEAEALRAARGIDPNVTVQTGHPAEAIAREATGHDLVVMGAHRRRILADVFVGTTIERVIRTSARPVLMASGPAAAPYRSVVAALDFSPSSDHAFATAAAFGMLDAPRLTLVHAYTPHAKGMMLYAGASDEAVQDHVLRTSVEATAAIRERRDGLSLPSSTLVTADAREGDPARVVAACVGDVDADLLVIGTRGATGLSRFLLGSVAETLLRTLEIDILTAPAPAGGGS